jgi:arylsulfatase
LCSLADGGIRFEWAFSTAPYTAPSIASILTGLYPSVHGVRQSAVSYLREEFDTLPELLRAAGYETAAFISNPVLERSHRLDQGFGVFDQEMPREERNRPGVVERVAQSATDAALAWAQIAAEPPWFMWVHFQDPHGPYEPPDASMGYDEKGGTRLPVLETDHSGLGGIPSYQALPGLFTREAYERRYADEIRYLDGHLKRLVEGLDALGDPPAVLVTADHGEAFGEDGYYFAHGHSVGLDQIRVPRRAGSARRGARRGEPPRRGSHAIARRRSRSSRSLARAAVVRDRKPGRGGIARPRHLRRARPARRGHRRRRLLRARPPQGGRG